MEEKPNKEPPKDTSQNGDIYEIIYGYGYGDDYRRKKLKNKELEKKLERTRRKIEKLTNEKDKKKKLIEHLKELQGRQPKPNSRPSSTNNNTKGFSSYRRSDNTR